MCGFSRSIVILQFVHRSRPSAHCDFNKHILSWALADIMLNAIVDNYDSEWQELRSLPDHRIHSSKTTFHSEVEERDIPDEQA